MDIISEIWGRILNEKKDIQDVESEDFLDNFNVPAKNAGRGRIRQPNLSSRGHQRKIRLTSATSPGVGANDITTSEIDLWLHFPRSRPQPLVFVAAAYGGRFRV